MALLDHRKTWQFDVTGTPQRCLEAFTSAFTGSKVGGFISLKWDVSHSGGRTLATYRGRSGITKFLTMFSKQSTQEEQAAIGSQVTFEISDGQNGKTTCVMWLSSATTRLGFIADARFIRPYMRAVEGRLRQVDADLIVSRS